MDSFNNEVEFERATLAGRYVCVEHSILHKNQTNKHFVKNNQNISFNPYRSGPYSHLIGSDIH